MSTPVIIDAIRSPIGALGGALATVRPDDLAAHVLKAIISQNNLNPALVEEVYLGCANQAGEDNRNVARMATLLAGFPVEVAAVTFNRFAGGAKGQRRKGLGSALVRHCLAEAADLGAEKVFELTYQSGFFRKLGFTDVDKKELPHKIWTDCLNCVKFPNCDETSLIISLPRK